jgi:hypothetical protein
MSRRGLQLLVWGLVLLHAQLALAAPKKKRSRARPRPAVTRPVAPPAQDAKPPAEPVSAHSPGTTPAPAAAPAPASHLETQRDAADERPPRAPWLEVAAGLRGFHRRLAFEGDLFERFQSHAITGPALAAEVSIFPLRYLGLTMNGHSALGLRTRDAQGKMYTTEVYDGEGGLAGRVFVGSFVLRPAVLAGIDRVLFTAPDEPKYSGRVSTSYTFLHPQIAVRYEPGAVAWFARGGYLILGSSGEFETDYFSRASGAGVEGTVGVAYTLSGGVELRAAVDYRRFMFDMNSEPGDRFVVGGAVDERLGVTLGLSHKQ